MNPDAQIAELETQIQELKQEKQDLEILLENTTAHADAVTQQLADKVFQHERAERDLQMSESRLQHLLATLEQEKTDLELILETMTAHADTVEAQLQAEALAALRQSEVQFRTLVEANPVALLILHIETGQILYRNPAVIALLGIPQEAPVITWRGRDFCYDPSDVERLKELYVQQGNVTNYELLVKRPDDSTLWVLLNWQPFVFQGQNTVLSALWDITARKQQEENLQRQVAELNQAIDQHKRDRQVKEITETEYFQHLRQRVQELRRSS
ncbi:putative Histidine kinase [Gloeomargarita lithophora Alchichica-D10]|uniref:Putative Histidine kinase n=1 Tax=Gloeomargarita lithophora Alchichica-D10 TaxID=1188229 RepID=A0A1J0AGT5_9CYAN|nr:PAS domain-containing protein [Gloeomargarita lithophora]APB35150.1 putative Histidine kinase [Gloeomargarita lithophora Alchichica-D10]